MKSPKKLIINADDYGACDAVNTAIEELAAAQLLGGVSILANGKLWEAATEFLRAHPPISAGIHLNLIEGLPVSTSPEINALLGNDQTLLARNALLARWIRHPLRVTYAVELEWRAQIERLLNSGLHLTHADSHQHVHAFPKAFRLAVKLCKDYGIPALRIPRERHRGRARMLSTWALHANLALSLRHTETAPLKHNDHFLGFKRAGGYGIDDLLLDLATLSEGVTELALHPSTQNFVPYPTLRGKDEYDALRSSELQAELARLQITLMSWSDL